MHFFCSSSLHWKTFLIAIMLSFMGIYHSHCAHGYMLKCCWIMLMRDNKANEFYVSLLDFIIVRPLWPGEELIKMQLLHKISSYERRVIVFSVKSFSINFLFRLCSDFSFDFFFLKKEYWVLRESLTLRESHKLCIYYDVCGTRWITNVYKLALEYRFAIEICIKCFYAVTVN